MAHEPELSSAVVASRGSCIYKKGCRALCRWSKISQMSDSLLLLNSVPKSSTRSKFCSLHYRRYWQSAPFNRSCNPGNKPILASVVRSGTRNAATIAVGAVHGRAWPTSNPHHTLHICIMRGNDRQPRTGQGSGIVRRICVAERTTRAHHAVGAGR